MTITINRDTLRNVTAAMCLLVVITFALLGLVALIVFTTVSPPLPHRSGRLPLCTETVGPARVAREGK